MTLKHPAAPGFWIRSPVAAAASAAMTPLNRHAARAALRTPALIIAILFEFKRGPIV